MGKLSRSWKMMGAAWRVLQQDKELLLFPLLSSVALLLVIASFATPFLDPSVREYFSSSSPDSPLLYLAAFGFYFVNYCVIIFFNAALIACAFKRMDGGDPTLAYGLGAAWKRLPQVLAWAALTSTVGFILRMIEERVPMVGKIVVALLGMAWAITSYLVVPVLVAEGKGPIDAYKSSVSLLKKSWGEQLVGNVSFGLIFMLLSIVPVAVAMAAIASGIKAIVIPVVALCVLCVIGLALVQSTLLAVYNAAIYRYAVDGDSPAGFNQALLAESFARK